MNRKVTLLSIVVLIFAGIVLFQWFKLEQMKSRIIYHRNRQIENAYALKLLGIVNGDFNRLDSLLEGNFEVENDKYIVINEATVFAQSDFNLNEEYSFGKTDFFGYEIHFEEDRITRITSYKP